MVHIVLVLAHTDGLGVNLDEFGQWVLQAPGNARCTAQAHVHVRHFLAGELAGRVNGCASFADDHPLHAAVHVMQAFHQVSGQFIGLAASCAVANGNQINAMLFAQFSQRVQRSFPVFAWLVREHRGGFNQLARAVDHSDFHTGANAWVQPHDHARTGWCSQQQITQVVCKHLDGDFFGVFSELGEQIALERQTKLDAPGPAHTFADQIVRGPRPVAPAQVQGDFSLRQRNHRRGLAAGKACKGGQLLWCRQHQLGVQNLKPTPPENGQRPMRRYAANRLVVIKIITELGVVWRIFVFARHQLGAEQTFAPEPAAQQLHQCSVFGPALAQNIAHTIQHGLHGGEVIPDFVLFKLDVSRGLV